MELMTNRGGGLAACAVGVSGSAEWTTSLQTWQCRHALRRGCLGGCEVVV